MSIFDKHIKIRKVLDVRVISTRATARELMNQISTGKKTIILDFDGIDFASRSFIDELNALFENKKGKKFKMINMNEQVTRMNSLVRESNKNDFWDEKKPDQPRADLVAM